MKRIKGVIGLVLLVMSVPALASPQYCASVSVQHDKGQRYLMTLKNNCNAVVIADSVQSFASPTLDSNGASRSIKPRPCCRALTKACGYAFPKAFETQRRSISSWH